MQNGKGDKNRPLVVSRKEFNNNWELAFGKKKTEQQSDKSDEKTDESWEST